MLTVKEINEVSFGKAGFSGYKPEDVDSFIDEVVESFEQLQAERDDALQQAQALAAQNAELVAKNSETQEKLGILAQKIESYRQEEDGIKEAILSAQKVAKDSVQIAKDKAEIILEDARASAKDILDNAKVEAAKATREYAVQVDAKKGELEEIKMQVTAFRSSLLEMYKKHLESIDHIPVFRQKETAEEEHPVEEPEPEQPQAEAEPVKEEQPAPVEEKAEEEIAQPEPVEEPVAPSQPEPTLQDKVDYSQEQMEISPALDEDDYLDDDLTEVGIDLKAYSDIPETLKKEKDSHFSNLEFGEDVDFGNRKKRRK